MSARRPIHFLLQIEPMSIGSTAKRVHTLAGFEWRIQLSPSRPNTLGIFLPRSMRLRAHPISLGRSMGARHGSALGSTFTISTI
jgi:hypothetical protein